MKQIKINPDVGICGDWSTSHGKGRIDNGHNNSDDENTIILCAKLTDGVLFSHGTRYDIDFTAN